MEAPANTYAPAELTADYAKLVKATPVLPISCHKREGMIILEHYQPHFWETESSTGDSIAKLWNNAEIRKLAEERTAKHYKTIYKSEIRRNLAFYSKAVLPTMYRPLLTKAIVQKYNAKKVLDPCVGWGGRLLGTLCIPETTFTGIEPFSKTYNGLREIANSVGVLNRAFLHNDGAEVILPTLPSGEYDMILTSPPYFTLEVYGHEESQSVNKFNTWELWCENFLKVVIKECIRCLKDGGVSAWSVKNMPKYKLKDKVVEYHKAFGFVIAETEGMTSTARNQGKAAKINEETFIFRKE